MSTPLSLLHSGFAILDTGYRVREGWKILFSRISEHLRGFFGHFGGDFRAIKVFEGTRLF